MLTFIFEIISRNVDYLPKHSSHIYEGVACILDTEHRITRFQVARHFCVTLEKSEGGADENVAIAIFWS